MIYSYNWLKELSQTKKTPEELADEITMHSFEIEGMEKVERNFDGFVVGEILELAQHPNADRLQLTKVSVGRKVLDIVCGARNISVGDKVPVALVGTKLPNGLEIKEAEIRGQKSFGMLCAEDELGLGTSHEGILLLDKELKNGTSLSEIFGKEDWAIEIKVLPDRAHDAVSHVGISREIAALENKELDYDYDELILPKKKSKALSVKVEDSELCPRYIGAVLKNVQIKQSPKWMRDRLEVCGIKSINNVVDATNYIMLELGQPMHAFDAGLSGNDIIVRRAKKDEEIVLLDGTSKKLVADDIVIANKKQAIALAGIMGGKESGVNENTKTIILESATFKAINIRKTRSRLALSTDASGRYEKELDPNLAEKAMVRVIEILEHIAGAELEGSIDAYPKKIKPWTIKLRNAYVEKLLGAKVASKTSKKILESLGMKVKDKKELLLVEVPTFRIDLKAEEDLIEEIGRINGYDKVENLAPKVPVTGTDLNRQRFFERLIKNILIGQGFSEVYNYSFYGLRDANLCQLGSIKHAELELPMNPEQALLRISLIPNILKNIRENLKNYKEFQIFEIGKVYWPNGDVLPEEKNILVGAIVLEKRSAKEEKFDKRNASAFYDIKASTDHLLSHLGIADFYYDNFNGSPLETPRSLWHESRSAEIKIEGVEQAIGYLGEINPFVLTQFDIHNRVVMFEIDVEKLAMVTQAELEYEPIRKHPIVVRDISLVAQAKVRVDEILETIQRAGGKTVLDADLFDIIDFADNTTSMAFHIMLGADERTLTGEEIETTMQKIIGELESNLDLKLRR